MGERFFHPNLSFANYGLNLLCIQFPVCLLNCVASAPNLADLSHLSHWFLCNCSTEGNGTVDMSKDCSVVSVSAWPCTPGSLHYISAMQSNDLKQLVAERRFLWEWEVGCIRTVVCTVCTENTVLIPQAQPLQRWNQGRHSLPWRRIQIWGLCTV